MLTTVQDYLKKNDNMDVRGECVMSSGLRFTGEGIPVIEAARIMKKDQQFVRQAMINGLLPIGLAFKKEGSNQYDYYISPKLFYEYTGYVYNEA